MKLHPEARPPFVACKSTLAVEAYRTYLTLRSLSWQAAGDSHEMSAKAAVLSETPKACTQCARTVTPQWRVGPEGECPEALQLPSCITSMGS